MQPPSNSQVSRPEVITHFYPLTNLVDSIFSEMDKVNITLLMLFDMSSTFDTIDHIIRVKRLHSLGGIKQALCCGVNNSQCDKTYLFYGVPQGSLDAPLVFSVYLQPISTIIRNHNIKYHCYADDIQMQLPMLGGL